MLHVEWIDGNRDPRCKPNPNYPNGIDLDFGNGNKQTCSVTLKYPAPRCGLFLIKCDRCGQRVGVTTAGRPDDPKSLTLACKSLFIDRSDDA